MRLAKIKGLVLEEIKSHLLFGFSF